MTKEKSLVAIPTEELATKLQDVVLSVTGNQGLQGFHKAFLMASGIEQLRALLTPEYMAPIMKLQGSKLGFRTDKDIVDYKPGPGYSMDIVKNCVIEAVLNGLQVTGNQFNIIAGNMYPTKEGIGYVLNNFKGLSYQVICGLPRMNNEGTSAAVEVSIKWNLNGDDNEAVVPIPIRVNKAMGIDAIIGKATRKGRAWLLSRITGSEVTDGEVEDAEGKVISTKLGNQNKKSEEDIEDSRMLLLIQDTTTVEELDFYLQNVSEKIRPAFDQKREELLAANKK